MGKTRNVCRPNAASENRNPTFFNFNLNEKEQWLFPSEDSQSFPPPRPPVLSPEPACGMDQTELSGLDHTPTTPAHPTERLSSSTPDGVCSVPSDASDLS